MTDSPPSDAPVVASLDPATVETHISVLFLVGDRVFKLKKPVRLNILDWRTREAREVACHREVELNRRLSPDVYLGVVDVVDDGVPVDHLVVMRRMPPERRLSRLLREGFDATAALTELAGTMAAFHAAADRSDEISSRATVDEVAARWETNLGVLRAHAGDGADATMVDAEVVERIAALATRFLAGRRALFDARIAAGLIVDGHGDLMAEDVYLLDDGPRALDCIEFSDHLRSVDVLDDVCFLAMDLERFGSRAVADGFLTAYDEASGERHPSSAAHHWIAYRAVVRAYVACVRADQGRTHAGADIAEARELLGLARSHLEEGRVRLVLVGGLPGTGKSTVASAIADATGWPVLHSDLVRKELLGVEPTTSAAAGFGEEAYSSEWTARTYETLLSRAEELLSMGESVILDASWTDAARRERAVEVAASTSSELVALECRAPRDLADARIGNRSDAVGSDATALIAAEMAETTTPWTGAVVIDTSTALDATVASALDAVR